MEGPEETCGQFNDETDCSICGWSGSSRRFTPLPASLTKLQKQHESILEITQALLRSVKEKNRTRDTESFMSGSVAIRYCNRLGKLVADHQREEERVLIPIVDRYLDSTASDSIRREHQEILEALQRVNGKLTRVNRPAQNESRRAAFKLASDFEVLAREHFSHEENVIYWFVSFYLS